MGSLTNCINKAGAAIPKEQADALVAAAKAYREVDGMSHQDAAVAAVQSEMRAALAEQVAIAQAMIEAGEALPKWLDAAQLAEDFRALETGATVTRPSAPATDEQAAETAEQSAFRASGFSMPDAGTYAQSILSPDGKTKALYNVRAWGGATKKYTLRKSVSFPGSTITGAPSQELGTFDSPEAAIAAFTEDSKQYRPDPKSSSYGKKNTVFTEDAAAKARARLKAKLNRPNAGLDPEMMQDGITMAGYHIEAGARAFADFARAMVDDLGEGIRPYLKSFYEAARNWPGFEAEGMTPTGEIDAIIQALEAENVQSPPQSPEPDTSDGPDADGVGATPVPADRGNADPDARAPGGRTGGQRRPASGGAGVSGGRAAAGGKRGNKPVHQQDGLFGAEGGAPRDPDSRGSAEGGRAGSPDDRQSAADARNDAEKAAPPVSLAEKLERQRAAESLPVKVADAANIAETLPFLMPSQHEDVLFAEERFQKPDGYGVLFANGTGTGKTFVGLGVVKRLVRQGKDNIIIIVPSQKIATDWVRSGKMLGLDVQTLADTKTPGRGVVITTYANFGQNRTLADRQWDAVVGDEAHNLDQSGEPNNVTTYLRHLRAITLHPDSAGARVDMIHRELVDELHAAEAEIKKLRPTDDMMQQEYDALASRKEKLSDKIEDLYGRYQIALEEQRAYIEANQGEVRPRALFLSATPFAYRHNIHWAEGYLFSFERGQVRLGNSTQGGYEQFMVQHFGYRIRYHKLTEPDANVDTNLMERNFNTWLRQQKVLSTRMLEVDADYDRKFVLLESEIGRRIDEALEYLRTGEGGLFSPLSERTAKKFDYLVRSRLLQSLKAQAAIPYIEQQLEAGRKVLVFYDFNHGGGVQAFNFDFGSELLSYSFSKSKGDDGSIRYSLTSETHDTEPRQTVETADSLEITDKDLIARLRQYRPDIFEIDTAGPNPRDLLRAAFPDIAEYSGEVSDGERTRLVDQFNKDGSSTRIIMAQKAANAGWSAHDTTGKHMRVLVNLGLPTAPVQAIQQEGRIYRIGQVSNAAFRYFNTGTNWERFAFASRIAQRAGTAENLAMGEDARALKDSFIEAFENAEPEVPSANDGIGGKERDRALAAAITDYDKAKTYYFGQMKNSAKRSQREGADYYATPEPVGYMMVQWAGVREGERLLEPSAGHGAIARWFPALHPRTVIEQSPDLASKLGLVTDAKLIHGDFMDHNIVNKYEAIVMNPPYGSGGATAIAHLDKATKHLSDTGRVVALIPTGPSADAKFEKWYEDAPDMYLRASIVLPRVTFERAGTSVATRIVVLDRITPKTLAGQATVDHGPKDITGIETIGELFDRIESMSVPDRVALPEPARAPAASQPASDGRSWPPEPGEREPGPLGDYGLTVTRERANNGKTVYEVTGSGTREHKETLKRLGGRWYGPKKAWTFWGETDPTDRIVDALKSVDFSVRIPRAEREAGSMSRKALDAVVRPIVAGIHEATGITVRPVGDLTDLPPHIRRQIKPGAIVDGIYDRDTRTVYLVGKNIANEAAAKVVLAHELMHPGSEAIIDDWNAVADQIDAITGPAATSIKNEVRRRYGAQTRQDFAREFLSVAAERAHQRGPIAELLARVRAAIRRFLKRFGLDVFPESQIDEWIRDSKEYLRTGGQGRDTILGERLPLSILDNAFAAWFGDSKVVDESGEPLVVYHGTHRDFHKFDASAPSVHIPLPGFYFTPDPNIASTFAEDGAGRTQDRLGNLFEPIDANVMPVYLSLQNPFDADVSKRKGQGMVSEKVIRQIIEDAKNRGHDGVILRGWKDGSGPVQYIAFEPTQIKSAIGNVGTYDPNNPDITASNQQAPTFYSGALAAVSRSPMARGSAGQWLAELSKGGAKQEEIEWLGLEEWLKEQGKSVPRDAVEAFIAENQVVLDEVVLGAPDFFNAPPAVEFGQDADGWYWSSPGIEELESQRGFESLEAAEYDYQNALEFADAQQSSESMTKYGQPEFTTPGGENYKEILIRVPNNPNRPFKHSHWDEVENVVAHVRFNERTDADGKRTLFLEEVQSDWHQAGHRHGYWRDPDVKQYDKFPASEGYTFRLSEEGRDVVVLDPEGHWVGTRTVQAWERDDTAAVEKKALELLNRHKENMARKPAGMVPDGPFKRSWEMLVMKRMLRWAAENGFDKLAWTTGLQQAIRAGQIEAVVTGAEWFNQTNGTVLVETLSNSDVIQTGYYDFNNLDGEAKRSLEELHGKAGVEKLLEQHAGGSPSGKVEGLNHQAGGEGMRAAYDQRIPNLLNKYVKKWGAKVGTTKIETNLGMRQDDINALPADLRKHYDETTEQMNALGEREDQEALEARQEIYVTRREIFEKAHMLKGRGETVHAIDITDGMRESVMAGQPMFSQRQTRMADVWAAYAGRDDAFKAPSSESTDLTTIAAEMDPDNKYGFTVADDGKTLKIKQQTGTDALGPVLGDTVDFRNIDTDRPYVRIFRAQNAEGSGGSAGYQMAMTWAHNNGKTLVPDSIITRVNRLRRTEAMISSMLRHGTSRHLEPHQDQFVGLLSDEAYRASQDALADAPPILQARVPAVYEEIATIKALLWHDESQYPPGSPEAQKAYYNNLEAMLLASAALAQRRLPAIERVSLEGVRNGTVPVRPADGIGHTTAQRAGVTQSVLHQHSHKGWVAKLAILVQGHAADAASFENQLWAESVAGPVSGPALQDAARSPVPGRLLYSQQAAPDQRSDLSGHPAGGGFSANAGPTEQAELFEGGFDLPSEALKDRILRRMADKFRRIKSLQRAIVAAGGRITERTNAYLAEELFQGKVAAQLEDFERDFVKPFVDALSAAERDHNITMDELDVFLYARHAPERNASIAEIRPDFARTGTPGSGMSDEQAAEIMAAFRADGKLEALKGLAQHVDRMNRHRLGVIREAGLESEETLHQWGEKFRHYVPLKGFLESGESSGRRMGRGFDVRGKESKRALGRRSLAESPIVHTIAQTEEAIIRARKNEVGQTFLSLVLDNPNPALWSVTSQQMKYKARYDARRGEVVYGPDPMFKYADNVVSVKRDGKEYFITLNDEGHLLARAMKNLGVEQTSTLVRGLGTLNRFLAAMNTAYNPEFVISNFARDIQTALINLVGEQSATGMLKEPEGMAGKVLRDVPLALAGAYHGLRELSGSNTMLARWLRASGQNEPAEVIEEWATWFNEYRDEGGKIGFFGLESIQDKQSNIKARLAEAGGDPRSRALRTFREFRDFIADINGAVENGTRLATYVNARRAGLSKKHAASLARNLTVNFNRKGEWGTLMNSLYLFYNASLQGSLRLMYAAKNPKVQKILGGIAVGGFLLAQMNRMLGGEDEDGESYYDRLARVSPWLFERNLVVMIPGSGGNYLTFPLPYGANAVFYAGTATNHMLHGGEPMKQATRIVKTAVEAFNPMGSGGSEKPINYVLKMLSPTVIDPFLELGLNENWAGREIFPRQPAYAAPKPPSELYFTSVSPVSKAVTDTLNRLTGGDSVQPGLISMSPEYIDHAFSFLLGGLGSLTVRSTRMAQGLYLGDVEARDVPFLRKFYGEIPDWSVNTEYYDLKNEASEAHDYVRRYRDAGDPEKARRYETRNRTLLSLKDEFAAVEKRTKRMRERQERIKADKEMSARERFEALEALESRIRDERQRVLRRYRRLQADAA